MNIKFRFIVFSIAALLIPILIVVTDKDNNWREWFWWPALVYGIWVVYELILKFKKNNP